MSVTLRQATGFDLDALNRLEQVAFSSEHFSRRQLWHLLNRANAQTLVAEGDEGQLLGYGTLLFRFGSRRARLYSFCVHPVARGTGLGRQLLEALEVAAGDQGAERLGLEVRADNQVALNLYRRMGFRLETWLEDYYSDGCAGWQMGKTIGSSVPGEAGESPVEQAG